MKKIDSLFLLSVALLTISGLVIFFSASFGLLSKDPAQAMSVLTNQVMGLGIGFFLLIFTSQINHYYLKKSAFFILLAAIVINLLLFIPAITLEHNGATRWIDLKYFTFQPSEILKIASIIYLAAWISHQKEKVKHFKYGVLPFIIMMSVIGGLLLAQSDTDTLVVIGLAGLSMLFVANIPIKQILVVILIGLSLIGTVILTRDYARQRFLSFLNLNQNTLGASYQINQSLITVGSGKIAGRGFGQSTQKYSNLPEPMGDSIFAVAAEEFGFIGTFFIVGLYLFFAQRGLKIAQKASDTFGRLTVVGLVILIISESFMNISAMLGLIPLSGQPLLFISHGGTALIMVLSSCGIIANISKYKNNNY